MNIGKKILIVGVSASGKTTLARRLSGILGIPVIHTDALMWKPGWHHVGEEVTVRSLKEITQRSEWILEGYIEEAAHPFVMQRAESIVYLDFRWYITAWRYIERNWRHRKDPRIELNGNPDRFRLIGFLRVLLKREVRYLNASLAQLPDQTKLIKLHTVREVEGFLRSLERSVP